MVRPTEQGKSTGHTLRNALQRHGVSDLLAGAVITVADKTLSFPHNLTNRTVHDRRFAIVMSNAKICRDSAASIIVIAPMTHRVDIKADTDVLINKADENGLECNCLAQLALIQPVRKQDVREKHGVLSDADYEAILEHFILMSSRE